MIRTIRCAAAAAIMTMLCLGLCLSASAASFSDIEGHWAQDALLGAVDQGWLSGFGDDTLRPDDPATGAQVVTILCRILDAQSGSGSGEWYADAAAKAVALGLIEPGETLTEPITRQRALRMVSEAFQLYGAREDTSCLDRFGDTVLLSKTERSAIAALVNKGYVSGYDNSLKLSSNLTRAEFCAILTRLFADGEIVLDGSVSDWVGNTLWIGCSSGDVSLSGVTADTVVVRTQGIQNLAVKSCAIGTLVLAQEGDLTLKWPESTALRVGSGTGTVKLTGKGTELDVTGDGREVELGSSAESVYISGENAHVTLSAGAGLAVVSGQDTTLTVKGTVQELEIDAEDVTVDGNGTIKSATVRAPGATLPPRVTPTEDIDPGLDGVTISLDHTDLLPIGEKLHVTAEVHGVSDELAGQVTWTIDGKTVKSEPLTLTGETLTLDYSYTYTRDLPSTSRITFRFDYVTRYGELQTVTAESSLKVENHDSYYYDEQDSKRVLALVTSKYAGDGTTEWAETHDYTKEDKEIFVRAKGYSSSSQYLIWINKTYQRVNIFEGRKWNWKLIRSGLVCTGAGDYRSGNKTPEGVWKVTYKEKGWYTSHYTVRPVVRFYGGGYAMHSRLYQPGSDTKFTDATIGVPVSLGCVRMMDEDIYWIYNNVPEGTTVVVH